MIRLASQKRDKMSGKTYGDVLTEGKCWDALPLGLRQTIARHAGVNPESVIFRAWSELPQPMQDRLYRIDWHIVYRAVEVQE